MKNGAPRVVLLIVDALPHRYVNRSVTPHLCGLIEEGGWAPGGVEGVMTSATYPNHASIITGSYPIDHGIFANWLPSPDGIAPADSVGPQVPTLFQAAKDAGRSTTAVVGDQHLIGVMGARTSDEHWPPNGEVPAGAATDELGYLKDEATLARILQAVEAAPDLVVAQLNEPDTKAHLYGPDSDVALQSYRDADAKVAEVAEALRKDWEKTVFLVLSDHDQYQVTEPEPIAAAEYLNRAGLNVQVIPEGSGALVAGEPVDRDVLLEIPGVAGAEPVRDGLTILWATPGRHFGPVPILGVHGGKETLIQVGAVSGGHPMVAPIAKSLANNQVRTVDWAPTIADLLGLSLPNNIACGNSLLNPSL